MPLVRMLTSLATPQHYFDVNEEVEASAEEAQAWVRDGIAELVTARKPETPERRRRKSIETR